MRWGDLITLISQTPPITDANGFQTPPGETARLVYGNKKAVWHNEFYEALQLGVEARFKFVVRRADYAGERLGEFNGKRFRILRVEESDNGEFITFTLSDLTERED